MNLRHAAFGLCMLFGLVQTATAQSPPGPYPLDYSCIQRIRCADENGNPFIRTVCCPNQECNLGECEPIGDCEMTPGTCVEIDPPPGTIVQTGYTPLWKVRIDAKFACTPIDPIIESGRTYEEAKAKACATMRYLEAYYHDRVCCYRISVVCKPCVQKCAPKRRRGLFGLIFGR